MRRPTSSLSLLAITTLCIFVALLVLLSSATTIASPALNTLGQKVMAEQAPSDPPLPDVLPDHLYLPQVFKAGESSNERDPEQVVSIAGAETDTERVPPPATDLYTFVSATGGELDQYLNREETIGGKLTFTIAITAPVLSAMMVNPDDGFV